MLTRFILIVFCLLSVSCEYLSLDDGSPCEWNGVPGRCVSVHRCPSATFHIRDKKFPAICAFDHKTPIICCTDCELVNNTRQVLYYDTRLGPLYKTGQKAKDVCLKYLHELNYPCKRRFSEILSWKFKYDAMNCTTPQRRIEDVMTTEGGVDAYREQFPHMALLGFGEDIENAEWICGGSVISERFILTAGHCGSSPTKGKVKYVALGILKRTDPPEMWHKYHLSRIVYHPLYKPPSKYHDIALLETDVPMPLGWQIRPACLHREDEMINYADATGWGKLGRRGELADTLQTVALKKFSDDDCSSHYPEHRLLVYGYDNNTQMCFGDKDERRDTCEGDSGGPLQSTWFRQCMYTIVGVTSTGRQCGVDHVPGLYTRVAYYIPWIESVVWP
ncbi:complement factor D-like [Anticarsia gemmatalis]|uniref:complement factor D-like n=1 Tax=Anticarsia gemmatalis TaxID=129554 RepID=UPI003F769385